MDRDERHGVECRSPRLPSSPSVHEKGPPELAAELQFTPFSSAEQCGVIAEIDSEQELSDWLDTSTPTVQELVHRHGAVILRGFTPGGNDRIREIVTRLSGPPLDYTERSSPRSEVAAGIYTSTDYPADQAIFLHNEQSYNLRFPERLYFYCVSAAQTGGETSVADTRRIYERVPAELRERFAKGYRLVRNYRPRMGLPWQEVFQTTDKDEVAAYCRANDIDLEWSGNDELRTSQLRQAIARHPVTGELCWFNHMTFFHVTTLGEELAEMMIDAYGEDGLPTNTYHADGSAIEPETMALLRKAYHAECVGTPWQEGDLMIVDNILSSHGRAPFTGLRKVVVSMAGAVRWDEVTTS
ncbi:TauD/TfdA family dioxygenase [Nonomuraea sp. NPDC046570]|uniref:TauD/TfdA family dioxygenase n=1 Tax=Nonomuraea sp. NPDC046570 TaxID=3155255 RepID=UPI0033FBF33A